MTTEVYWHCIFCVDSLDSTVFELDKNFCLAFPPSWTDRLPVHNVNGKFLTKACFDSRWNCCGLRFPESTLFDEPTATVITRKILGKKIITLYTESTEADLASQDRIAPPSLNPVILKKACLVSSAKHKKVLCIFCSDDGLFRVFHTIYCDAWRNFPLKHLTIR